MLPFHLTSTLERLLEGRPRAALAVRAAAISSGYRSGAASPAVIRDDDDALAYALARMPATYAAIDAVLTEVRRRLPMLSPESLLDLGAGPGTAVFAGTAHWPSLDDVTLLDGSAAFRALSRSLLAGSGLPALAKAKVVAASFATSLDTDVGGADAVTAAYVLAELDEAAQDRLVREAWSRTRRLLVLVEPGTPAGFLRLARARAGLVEQGARIVAPCVHAVACPMIAPDWCHFSRRLPRSRDHRLAKRAAAPFEDEKFAYLAVARSDTASAAHGRVLRPPLTGKAGIELTLCTAEGIAALRVPRRDRQAHAAVRRVDWGDLVTVHPGVGAP